ncbi:MAG: hypothetical protein IJ155_03600 [Prevotella sp.]|nr:hypothetical protein [Prevotella sp.]MBQ9203307.1 hypothetical protein [Prevotella sp.]
MKQIVLTLTAAAMMCSLSATAQTRVKNVYTEAKSFNVEQVQNTEQTTQVNRYLMAGYNTLCLPMSMSADQLAASGITVERMAAIHQEGSTLKLYFVDCTNEGIEAGVPYLIYSPKTQYLRVKNTDAARIATELKTVRMSDGQGNQVAFSSSWDVKQKDGLFGIPARQNVTPLESVLVRTTGDLSFLPTRCGFAWEQQSSTAEALEIVHASDADVTAINAVRNDDATAADAYDLAGRKHAAPVKGVNIINGKKVVK